MSDEFSTVPFQLILCETTNAILARFRLAAVAIIWFFFLWHTHKKNTKLGTVNYENLVVVGLAMKSLKFNSCDFVLRTYVPYGYQDYEKVYYLG